ncbi:plastocyanin/azurin family copper-binding protein [Halorussus salinisoli]|uniref:plastocyanin/azurin family copper-binding protein n=1 Tax=Halorussus salinisoli TaxID=2558242 RepID=UPI0010C1CB57|nr:plastocyanin/azurin family copper-binding protein [Halorussus salinisoli]
MNQTRRNVLRVLGVAGVAGVAGCTTGGSDGSDGETTTESEETTEGGSSGESWEQASTVEMTDDLAYAPKRIEVSKGTTVTWENVGSIGHTITAYEDEIPDDASYFASGGFDSQSAASDGYPDEGNVKEGESYEYTFETKGTYKYYCIPHEMNGMVGYVKVV